MKGMEEIWTLTLLLLVCILWGITNPLLKKASIGIENVKAENFIYQVS